ncbi:MAG: hypothetical protein LAT61_10515 [Alcanivorax sp.]|nr:hypothetical protein [Alcanivorax sp.]
MAARLALGFFILIFCGVSYGQASHNFYYGDVNGDGRKDLLVVPDRHVYQEILVSLSPFMAVTHHNGYESFVIWDVADGGAGIQQVGFNQYSPKGLIKADIHMEDISGNGLLDVLVVFGNEDIAAVYIYNFYDAYSRGARRLSLSPFRDGLPAHHYIELVEGSGSGRLDIVVRNYASGVEHRLVNNGNTHWVMSSVSTENPPHNPQPGPDGNIVGASAINFSVNMGQAEFAIPIVLPQGSAGVQPELSVSYASSAGYGPAGMGTAISGLSYIERCPMTYERDGLVRGVAGSSSDRACLDGNPLILQSGSYWGNGSTYYTESETFSRIQYSSGHFTVHAKNGDVYRYGATAQNRIPGGIGNGAVARWALETVTNQRGFGYRISYISNSGALFPEKIEYTVNVSGPSSPMIEVIFDYDEDTFKKYTSLHGVRYNSGLRLKNIDVYVDGQIFRKNNFHYVVNPVTGRSLISSFQECAGGDLCTKPTQLHWSMGEAPDFSVGKMVSFPRTPLTMWEALAGDHTGGANRWIDIDRDGKDDYCRIATLDFPAETGSMSVSCFSGIGESGFSDEIVIANSLTGGLKPPTVPTVGNYNWNADPSWIDINNNGLSDFCYSSPLSSSAASGPDVDVIKCHMNSASGADRFSNIMTAHVVRPASIAKIRGRSWQDFNGNGKYDYCFVNINQPNNLRLVCHEQGENFTFWDSAGHSSPLFNVKIDEIGSWKDVNGDGLPDYCWVKDDEIECLINDSGSGFKSATWKKSGNNLKAGDEADYVEGEMMSAFFNSMMFDFTGNGYPDFCRIFVDSQNGTGGYRAACLESAGTGWGDDIISAYHQVSATPAGTGIPLALSTSFVDINQNGYIDWCIEKDKKLTCFLTGGDGFGSDPVIFDLPQYGGFGYSGYNRAWSDISGSGDSSYCALYSIWIGNTAFACASRSSSDPVDYLVRVENGFGLAYEVSYSDSSDEEVYEYDLGPGSDGQVYVSSGMRLVQTLSVSDGRGGYNQQHYFYRNFGYFPYGMGGSGFEYTRVTEATSGRRSEDWYHLDSTGHKTGLVYKSAVSYPISSGGYRLISEDETSWKVRIYGSGHSVDSTRSSIWNKDSQASLRYTVLPADGLSRQYELDGTLISETETVNIYDELGELLSQSTHIEGNNQYFHKSLVNTWHHDTGSNWHLSRLMRAETTQSGTYMGDAIPAQTRVAAWTYGAFQQLASEILEPDNPELRRETHYTYDQRGMTTQVTVLSPNGTSRTTNYSHDSRGRFMTQETNALGHTTHYGYDELLGVRTVAADVNGLITTWEYDPFGRLVRTRTPDGNQVLASVSLCDTGCPEHAVYYSTKQTVSATGDMLSPPVTQYHDLLGRDVEVRTLGFNGESIIMAQIEYDADGHIKRQSEPRKSGEPVIWSTVIERDVMGRVLSEQPASGMIMSYSYGGLASSQTASWMDPVDAQLHERTQTTLEDVTGNTRTVTDNAGRQVSFSYDAFDNQLAVTTQDMVLHTTYDDMGRRLSFSDPGVGTWRYGYDGFDQVVLQENGNGRRVCTAYDALGRRVARLDDYATNLNWEAALAAAQDGCADGTPDAIWVYDDPAKGIGRLANMSTSEGYQQQMFYDGLGRVYRSLTEFAGQQLEAERQYDAAGRVVLEQLPTQGEDPLEVRRDYNAQGFLSEVGVVDSQIFYWRALEADARGAVIEEHLSNGAIRRQHAYDAATGILSQVRSKKMVSTGWDIQSESYVFNAAGSMRSRQETLPVINQHIHEYFEYDNVDRMVDASIENLNQPSLSYTQLVQYSPGGNVESRSDVGSYQYGESCTVGSDTYQPGPHAVTSVSGITSRSYCYDEGGNMIQGNGNTIAYNSFGKPAEIERSGASSSFIYGINRELLKQTHVIDGVTTEQFHFGAYQVTVTQGGQDAGVRERYQLAGGLILSFEDMDYDGVIESYTFSDVLGSITAVADAFGNVTERHRYDPWGRPRQYMNWLAMTESTWYDTQRYSQATSRGFTGHEMLDHVGIIHMGGRIFDPAVGRFLGADPVVKGMGDTEAYNRYSYVGNNPMSYTDPTGYFRSGLGIGSRFKREARRFESRYRNEIKAFVTGGMEPLARYGGRELARFVERNKYGGQILGLVTIAGCSVASAGTAAPGCVAAVQGISTGSMAYGTGQSIEHALRAGVEVAAIAMADGMIAGKIGGYTQNMNPMRKAAVGAGLHGMRGATFAAINGYDIRSGLIGGATEGALGGAISRFTVDSTTGQIAIAAMVSGTVSEVSGGNFATGAVTGAMGYLFNELGERIGSENEVYESETWHSLIGLDAGDEAAMYWAQKHMETGNSLYAIPGMAASLWTPDTYLDTFSTLLGGGLGSGALRGFRVGKEFSFGRNLRVAPFGNRTGHPTGRLPHYHRRVVDPSTGQTRPGQGIKRHRPWDTRATDQSLRDRF